MDIYKIIEENVVSQMTPVIELTLIETVSTGRYKLHSCNTEWATIGDTVTIDSVDYLVVDFEINEFLIVTGPSLPVQLYFQLSEPTFEYGNHRKVAIERDKQKDKRTITPMVYMMLVRNNRVKDYDSAYSFDGDARFFFLGTYNEKKDDIDTHQQEVIEPMRALAKYFREKWNEREDIFEQITECAEQDWMNFGSPQIWGNSPRIFDENLSGVENAFTILSTADEDCCESIPAPSCLPATLSFDSTLAETLPSGTSLNILIEDQDGNTPDYSYSAATDTLTIQSPSGGEVAMTYNGSAITPTPAGEAKAITFKNSAGTNLGAVTTDTANALDVVAADITKTDSDGTVTNVAAGVNVVCTQAIPSGPPYKTGQTVSQTAGDDGDTERGTGASISTLSWNNPYGNTTRFLDILGGTAFADDIVIDWSTQNLNAGTVLGWYRVPAAIKTFAQAMADQQAGITHSGFTLWRIPNVGELFSICNYQAPGVTDLLNYAPFNIDQPGSGNRLWTCTNGGQAMSLLESGAIAVVTKLNSQMYIVCRYFTLAELGL